MWRLGTIAVLVAACSGPAKPKTSVVTSEPEREVSPGGAKAGAPADRPEPETKAPPPKREVDARPDTPAGEAAKRDAELAARAAGYVDAFTNTEPVLTRDGKRVVFVSTRDGLPQLYIAETAKPKAAATRLVATKERVTDAFPTKDGKAILFRSDTGADENWSIFRVGLDGKDLVELTPGERINRDVFVVPDGAPDKMFFSARKMAESRSTLYVASAVKAEEAKAIYTDEKPAFLSDVAPDGKTALVMQYPSRAENYLIRIDTASGKAQTLYPAEGQKISIFSASFSADGKQVYVGTDLGAEQAVILALDAKTGKELARYAITPATAQIVYLNVAKRGGLIAVSVVVGNRSEIRLLDGKKLAPAAKVEMPLGQGFAGAFSEDGTRLPAQWSTARAPTDLYAIDARTGKVAPLRQEERPSLQELPAIETTIAEIAAFDGGKIPTNVYLPVGEQGKPHPVLVVYHGGPAGISMIRWNPGTAYFLSLGYAVVEPNVRGSSGFGRAFEAADNGRGRLDAFKDIETSARWVARQPWADKDRLVVYGGSYGGYTTLVALSRWPDIWRAGVDQFGVVNLKTFMATTSGLIRQIFLLEFGDPEREGAFLESISPFTDVGKIVDPTFVYAGANDPRVPRSESDLIVKALRQRGVPAEYMVADNEGHSLARRENQIAFYARCARFLEAHLR
jgi:dipeptidyl aminopeptidase/acylaminoacyl peptidase